MTRQQAIEIAKSRHIARCKALWSAWTTNIPEPHDEDYGFHHGWYQVGEFNIGGHEYAPGPTYSID